MGLLGGFLALMVSGVPVAIAMALASLAYVMISGNIPDFVVIHRMYGGVDSFPLLAVPFFIWAGNLMNSAGITNRIYNFALALVQNGDIIELDVSKGILELKVSAQEIKKRKAKWKAPKPPLARGYWRLYFDHVNQADEGADLDFLVGSSGDFVPRDNH